MAGNDSNPSSKKSWLEITKKNIPSLSPPVWTSLTFELVNEKGERTTNPKLRVGHVVPTLIKLGFESPTNIGPRNGGIYLNFEKGFNPITKFNGFKNRIPINLEGAKNVYLRVQKLDELRARQIQKNKPIRIIGMGNLVPKENVEKYIKKFGVTKGPLRPIWFTLTETESEETKKFLSKTNSLDFTVEIERNGLILPSILPINGKRICIETEPKFRQCHNCFRRGHSHKKCKFEKVKLKDYKLALDTMIKESNQEINDLHQATPNTEETEEDFNEVESEVPEQEETKSMEPESEEPKPKEPKSYEPKDPEPSTQDVQKSEGCTKENHDLSLKNESLNSSTQPQEFVEPPKRIKHQYRQTARQTNKTNKNKMKRSSSRSTSSKRQRSSQSVSPSQRLLKDLLQTPTNSI